MHIAFISTRPVSHIKKEFHRDQFIFDSLEKYGHQLIGICPPTVPMNTWDKVYGRLVRALGLTYRHERSPRVLRIQGKFIQEALSERHYELIFSLSSLFTCYLEITKPIICWGDAVFPGIVNFYESHTNLDFISKYQGHIAERNALRKCAITILSSNWAANMAARYYKFSQDRLRVVSYGPNLHEVPSQDEIENANKLKTTDKKTLKCVVIGVDWKRKGAHIAYHAVDILRKQNYNVQLLTIGMIAPADYVDKPGLITMPRLNKHIPDEWNTLKKALLSSDVLLLPSKADFTPHVINEAYAFGLPVISSRVGAIPEMIEHGITGFCVENSDDAEAYADYLALLYKDQARLISMQIAARNKYEHELSIEVMARKLTATFNYALDSRNQ